MDLEDMDLEDMDDAGNDPPVINPSRTAPMPGQTGFDNHPLIIRQPKQAGHGNLQKVV